MNLFFCFLTKPAQVSSTIKSSGNVNHHICQFINVIHFTLAFTNQATLNTLPLLKRTCTALSEPLFCTVVHLRPISHTRQLLQLTLFDKIRFPISHSNQTRYPYKYKSQHKARPETWGFIEGLWPPKAFGKFENNYWKTKTLLTSNL